MSYWCHLLQEAGEFVTGLQSVLEQFAHAMLHIGQRYTLQETSEILAIAQGPLSQGSDPLAERPAVLRPGSRESACQSARMGHRPLHAPILECARGEYSQQR